MSEKFELANLETLDAVEVFTSGAIDSIIADIKAEVARHEPDLSTDKGRKAIASLAANVAKAKVRLDGAGKDLVHDWKEQAKAVDTVRKALRDELDEIKVQARKPLTEWEEEQQRIKDQERIDAENELARLKLQAEILQAEIEAHAEDAIRTQAIEQEKVAEEQRKQQEELDRQKAEIDAQKQKLIDDEKDRLQAEVDRIAEEKRIKEQEEHNRIVAEKRKKEEEERIEKAKQDAIADEKKRQEEADALELAEKLKREENKRIRTRTHNQIAEALFSNGIQSDYAKQVVDLIADGKIPKVSITY